jgi:hypothetical protein
MKFPLVLGIAIAIFAVIIVGFVAVYPLLYPTYSHRYRLTLEVETPDGLKTASGVIEPQKIAQPRILTNRGSHSGLKGDAVFLDLGNGNNVTALLTLGPNGSNVDGPVSLAIKAFKIPTCNQAFCQWHAIARTRGQRDLPPELTPTLVTFSDVSDPKTARVVQPGEFQAVFGPGYHFKRAWIEMTSDPVSRGIESKLPFLVTHRNELTRSRVMWAGEGYVLGMGQFRVGDN